MTPHDRWLEPDDEPEFEICDECEGFGFIDVDDDAHECKACEGYGEVILTDAERRQKAFDDFDPPDELENFHD